MSLRRAAYGAREELEAADEAPATERLADVLSGAATGGALAAIVAVLALGALHVVREAAGFGGLIPLGGPGLETLAIGAGLVGIASLACALAAALVRRGASSRQEVP
jgi:hypothetical protein